MKAEGRRFPGGRKAGTAWVTPGMRARTGQEKAPRPQADFFPGSHEDRRRRAAEALVAALQSKAQRRAAIRAMPLQEARLAALRWLDVLEERFRRTGSFYG
jgi:hypothetical protein